MPVSSAAWIVGRSSGIVTVVARAGTPMHDSNNALTRNGVERRIEPPQERRPGGERVEGREGGKGFPARRPDAS